MGKYPHSHRERASLAARLAGKRGANQVLAPVEVDLQLQSRQRFHGRALVSEKCTSPAFFSEFNRYQLFAISGSNVSIFTNIFAKQILKYRFLKIP